MLETHTPVFRDDASGSDAPYYFRENSALWDWGGSDIVFAPQYPNKLVVRPSRTAVPGTKTLTEEHIGKLQALIAAHTAGPVIVEGFTNAAAVSTV